MDGLHCGRNVFLLLSAQGADGQSAAFAMFTGRAQDPQGASVAGATVTATNQETGIVRTTQTTSDGLYRFDNLPPGIYDVAIEARSFAKVEVKNVKCWSASSATSTSTLACRGEAVRDCNLGSAAHRNYQNRRFYGDR